MRCAFIGPNPTGELITSELAVICSQWTKARKKPPTSQNGHQEKTQNSMPVLQLTMDAYG
jgi:hypothetical protein